MLIRVPIGDGSDGYIVAEVDPNDLGEEEVVLATANGEALAVAPVSLTASIDRVIPAVLAMVDRLAQGPRVPDEISVEFGLRIGGEVGFIFAKGTSEASFTVTVAWRRP